MAASRERMNELERYLAGKTIDYDNSEIPDAAFPIEGITCGHIRMACLAIRKLAEVEAERDALDAENDEMSEHSKALRDENVRLTAQVARLREALEEAEKAVNASYAEAQAEWQGLDTVGKKQSDIVWNWREKRRAALAETPAHVLQQYRNGVLSEIYDWHQEQAKECHKNGEHDAGGFHSGCAAAIDAMKEGDNGPD